VNISARQSLRPNSSCAICKSKVRGRALGSLGHPDDLVPLFQARVDAGIEEVTFNFVTPNPGQLELFMTRVRPHLKLPV
jgi:hypothetical protein